MTTTYTNINEGYAMGGARPAWLQQAAKEQRDKMVLEMVDEMREAGQANWEWEDFQFAYLIKCGLVSLPKRLNNAI